LAKLIANGIIQYNQQTHKYCFSNGQSIFRPSEESLVETVARPTRTTTKQNQVNFVTLTSGVSDFWAEHNENEDEEGAVKAVCDVFIGDTVPFDLLLGQPWQIWNKVTTLWNKMGGKKLP